VDNKFYTKTEENLCAKHLEGNSKEGSEARASLASLEHTPLTVTTVALLPDFCTHLPNSYCKRHLYALVFAVISVIECNKLLKI